MKPRKTTYLAHRWIGLVIALQLLAWSTGGLIFSVLDIRGVRGETDALMRDRVGLEPASLEGLPAGVREAVAALGPGAVGGVELIDRGVGPHWEVRGLSGETLARLHTGGEPVGPVTGEEASTIAAADFLPGAPVALVQYIDADPPLEYRGGPLPAWRVDLDHAKQPHVYIDARTGRIVARRNQSWRIFDFFWMLHTMDYTGRDNFNHPLLTVASLLAVATAGTGLSLWGWRMVSKARRRRKHAPRR